jgi:hypothetical protein
MLRRAALRGRVPWAIVPGFEVPGFIPTCRLVGKQGSQMPRNDGRGAALFRVSVGSACAALALVTDMAELNDLVVPNV